MKSPGEDYRKKQRKDDRFAQIAGHSENYFHSEFPLVFLMGLNKITIQNKTP